MWIFSRNRGKFRKYVQILVSRTSSNFKTRRSALKRHGFASQFQLFSLFGNPRRSSYSYLNYYIKSYLERFSSILPSFLPCSSPIFKYYKLCNCRSHLKGPTESYQLYNQTGEFYKLITPLKCL